MLLVLQEGLDNDDDGDETGWSHRERGAKQSVHNQLTSKRCWPRWDRKEVRPPNLGEPKGELGHPVPQLVWAVGE